MDKLKHFALTYGCLLTAFTVFAALDTFVIPDAKSSVSEMNLTAFSDEAASSAAQSGTDEAENSAFAEAQKNQQKHRNRNGSKFAASVFAQPADGEGVSGEYSDEHISISLSEYNYCDTRVYVADVVLSSAQYLKTAFADDTYGKNVTAVTSEIAAAHDAILAVNGDFYGSQEKGYVIRNGVAYRSTDNGADVLCVYADGTMQIMHSAEETADELVDEGVWQAFCFGPGLVENGEVLVTDGQEVGRHLASNPRTAIGMIEPLHYIFVVSDGRTEESAGLSLLQLAEFTRDLGASTVYNLDGGGSSSMVFKGEIVNQPTNTGRTIEERKVSDIVYIG